MKFASSIVLFALWLTVAASALALLVDAQEPADLVQRQGIGSSQLILHRNLKNAGMKLQQLRSAVKSTS